MTDGMDTSDTPAGAAGDEPRIRIIDTAPGPGQRAAAARTPLRR